MKAELLWVNSYLLVAAIFMVGVVFSLAILPKTRKDENALLLLFFGLFTLHLSSTILTNFQVIPPVNRNYGNYFIYFLYGPVFMGYVGESLRKNLHYQRWLIFWAMLGVAAAFVQISVEIYSGLNLISLIVSLSISINTIRKDRKHARQSSTWTFFSTALFLLIVFSFFIEISVGRHNPFWVEDFVQYIYGTVLILMALGFLWFFVRQPTLFLNVKMKAIGKGMELPAVDPATPTQLALLVDTLENERLYFDSSLTRESLSTLTGISSHRISELINRNFEINFSEWVNRYRIQEAKRLLKNQSHELSVKEICFRVGFNSKSAFNKAFKKCTGMTPSFFKEKGNGKQHLV